MILTTDGTWVTTDIKVVTEQQVGRYLVQAYYWHDGEPVYRIMLNGEKVRCMTDYEERRHPKRAAMVGHAMVEALKAKGSNK